MNETIGSPRQKAIVQLLENFEHLSREKIAENISAIYPASKATLARDLAYLLQHKQIIAIGNGPHRKYQSLPTHPLLKRVDIHTYFTLEADQRQHVQTSFNMSIFNQLHDLISQSEHIDLNKTFRSFSTEIKKLDSTILQRELERFMIELSWKSSKIEGNTYSLLETERLIQAKEEAQGHSKKEMVMILNHKDAFQTIVQNRTTFRHITLNSISELHNILTKDLSIDGGIRKHAVGITGTTYKPLSNEWHLKESLEKLIQVINTTEHPLEKALIIVSMIAYLQPFADGNKRTARMLANAVLLAHDYFPLSYRSVDENEYKAAQILFYEMNNLYHVKRLFLEQYQFALKTYFL